MASQLKNTLAFTLAAGGHVVVAHGLNWAGLPVVPDTVFVPSDNIAVSAVDATNLTLTNIGDTSASGTILVESWHSIERAFGDIANQHLTPQPFVISSAAAAAGSNFAPARELFLASSWAPGADPLVYFTTIQAALAQAATMTPGYNLAGANSQINIVCSPGLYTGDFTLISGVNIVSKARNSVQFPGIVTYHPGQGVNVPQAALTEQVVLRNVWLTTGALNIDSTGKGGVGVVQVFLEGCSLSVVTALGRALPLDNLFIWDSISLANAGNSITDFTGAVNSEGFEFIGSRIRGLVIAGASVGRMQGGEIVGTGTISLTGASTLTLQGINNRLATGVASGCTFNHQGGQSTGVVTSAAGATCDLRGADYITSANLVGPGTILANNITTTDATLVGPGTLDLTKRVTQFTSTGGASPDAIVLPNGSYTGQQVTVVHAVDGGSGVITPVTAGNFATVTLTNRWESAVFEWTGAAWNILVATPVAIVA